MDQRKIKKVKAELTGHAIIMKRTEAILKRFLMAVTAAREANEKAAAVALEAGRAMAEIEKGTKARALRQAAIAAEHNARARESNHAEHAQYCEECGDCIECYAEDACPGTENGEHVPPDEAKV